MKLIKIKKLINRDMEEFGEHYVYRCETCGKEETFVYRPKNPLCGRCSGKIIKKKGLNYKQMQDIQRYKLEASNEQIDFLVREFMDEFCKRFSK